jgi:hypothetical protein
MGRFLGTLVLTTRWNLLRKRVAGGLGVDGEPQDRERSDEFIGAFTGFQQKSVVLFEFYFFYCTFFESETLALQRI